MLYSLPPRPRSHACTSEPDVVGAVGTYGSSHTQELGEAGAVVMYGLNHTQELGEAGAIVTYGSSHTQELGEAGAVNRMYGLNRTDNSHCAWGGPEDQLKAADPRDEFLGPFVAQLELGAVASFAFDKSNTHSSDVEYTV